MKAPKFLPWIARKAGISDALALKLWRRALSESEYLTGSTSSPEYWGMAVERFLGLAEDEAETPQECQLVLAPRLTWFVQHQNRVSMLSLLAAQNTYRLWQNTMESFNPLRQAA